MSFEMKEHDMEGKGERRCESYWGRWAEKERGVDLREEWHLQTADSLHSPHPVGQRLVLSIHILVPVSPFGDLSVRKEIQAFFSLLFIYFLVGSNRRTFPLLSLVLFSLHGFNCQWDHMVSSLTIIPSLRLLVHWRQGRHKWGVTSVCLYHCLPPLFWSLDRSPLCLYHCLPPSPDLWIEVLCSCPVHTVHRADCVIADRHYHPCPCM